MTNRDILFRAKRVDNGEWVYGDFTHDKENRAIIRRIVAQPLFMDENGNFSDTIYACSDYVVDPDTVSQVTGLYDKNGNRIYEGDIVKARIGLDEYTGIVKYDEDCAMFIVVAFERDDKVHTDKLYVGCEFITEVIGNKWDNKSLLENNNE